MKKVDLLCTHTHTHTHTHAHAHTEPFVAFSVYVGIPSAKN